MFLRGIIFLKVLLWMFYDELSLKKILFSIFSLELSLQKIFIRKNIIVKIITQYFVQRICYVHKQCTTFLSPSILWPLVWVTLRIRGNPLPVSWPEK